MTRRRRWRRRRHLKRLAAILTNGDQIIGSYAITENVLPVSPLGNIAFKADLVVLRGTGQFAHATGQAVAVATANVFTKTFTVEFGGRLTTIP